MAERVPFFTLFESFQAPRQLRLLLHDACAVSGVLDREARTLEVQIECGETLPQAAQDALQQNVGHINFLLTFPFHRHSAAKRCAALHAAVYAPAQTAGGHTPPHTYHIIVVR